MHTNEFGCTFLLRCVSDCKMLSYIDEPNIDVSKTRNSGGCYFKNMVVEVLI